MPVGSLASNTSSVTPKSRRVLSNKELEEKRANSLCFYCDERYFPGTNVLARFMDWR